MNAQVKTELKEQFTKWYAGCVCEAIKANPGDMRAIDAIKPDLRLSTMKPLHASWLVNSFTAMKKNGDLIQSGWRRNGIEDAFRSAASTVSTVVTAPESDESYDVQWSNKASLSRRVFDIPGPLRILSSNDDLHRMVFLEEFLHRDLCQSRLGGREGSSTCTLIAVLSSQRILCWILQLPGSKASSFEEESIKIFLDCVSPGNDLYDRKVKAGFLSVFMALRLASGSPAMMIVETRAHVRLLATHPSKVKLKAKGFAHAC